MPLNTTIPTLDRWRTAPTIDTLRSIYDASAPQWQDNLARLGQLHDYQLLFNNHAVRTCLSHVDQTSHVLDCGVGTGAFSLALLDSVNQPAHVSGVDISHPMLTHAQQILENRCRTLDLRWGDIKSLPFADEFFDAVIFAHVLEHMADPIETLREMVRVLKPGAPLIGSVTRKGLGQVFISLRWQNRGYASNQLDSFLQAAGLEAVRSFDYGTGWSKWMCIATIGIKPRRENEV
ncbi:methylase involved in ubiquinone menaquinone biosynthesis [Leptolyngbya sp. Heron Island J]|uniref:class I SAM-dependent methyltransferase n=1 Tax=Leptolyngbya sp. Heron Island J TaxID=1385935 RepID=UPI0003B9943E|nr:class I SAM-dependent methyltransferase [Leptolyngbya sp. Heron Island J]ESA35312.1 methylase involved in ubiquinone menaquinone biosynthesis [Leptolyngbya sp. Heron Island J]